MHTQQTTLIYTCPDHIYWAKDSAGIVVIDERSQKAHRFTGVETAVWDWLMLGYTDSQVAQFTAVLLDIPLPQAHHHLYHQLQAWQQRGLLALQGGEDG